jgi:hypothetical protein
MVTNASIADISMLEQLNNNSGGGSGGNLFTPDAFSGDNTLAMEEKEEQIEQLKAQIEMLEVKESDFKVRVDDLTEENETLSGSVKKWMSKFD